MFKRKPPRGPDESVVLVLAALELLSDALVTYTVKITAAAESLAVSAEKLATIKEVDLQIRRDFPNGTPPHIGVRYGPQT